MPISAHETWEVQDATKIQAYMVCPRKYFYEYVLGWRTKVPSNHLVFGTAWHLAMEVVLEEGTAPDSLAKAYKAFESNYRETFDPTWDAGHSPQNPATVLRALPMYAEKYADDDFKVLRIEVAGSIPVDSRRVIHFKEDTICEGREGIFSLEHKTGSSYSDSWISQWPQKMQVGVYTHALYSMYPENQVWGVKINGFFPHAPMRMRKDGLPYKGAKDIEFHRVPIRRDIKSLNAWLWEVNRWLDNIEDDFQRLSESTEDDPIMEAFPKNTESCTKYGKKCDFFDYCTSWHNPLREAHEPPVDLHVQHWDPRNMDHVRETIKL